MRKTTLFIFVSLFVCGFLVRAQNPQQDKAKLEQERKDLEKEISDMQALYSQVKGQTNKAMGQLSLINGKINLQERYISNINKQIRSIDDDIYISELELYRLQKQLDTLKKQYASMVVYAYENRSNYDFLNFIFSAESFNDALHRIAYLNTLRHYREKQLGDIKETQQLIVQRKVQQVRIKADKNDALTNQTRQMDELASQKDEKAKVVSKLKSQGKDLQKQITVKKKRDSQIESRITSVINRIKKDEEAKAKAEEAARLKAEAEKNPVGNTVTANPTGNNTTAVNPANSKTTTTTSKPITVWNTAEDLKLNTDFESNRGHLPWPVDNGYVKIHFSNYSIEGTDLKGVNPGITISTQVGTSVKSVFQGEVVDVYNTGESWAVTVRHGKYFTVYSNLGNVNVSKGSSVSTGQTIGKAGQDDDGSGGMVDFILMVENRNVNPESWLHR